MFYRKLIRALSGFSLLVVLNCSGAGIQSSNDVVKPDQSNNFGIILPPWDPLPSQTCSYTKPKFKRPGDFLPDCSGTSPRDIAMDRLYPNVMGQKCCCEGYYNTGDCLHYCGMIGAQSVIVPGCDAACQADYNGGTC